MREWRVTNRTQGRLEIRDIRKVLDPGEWAIVAEPLPDSIKYLVGDRRVLVEEIDRSAQAVKKTSGSPQAPKPDTAPAVLDRKQRKTAEQ